MKKHWIHIDVNGEKNSLAILSPIKTNGESDCGYRFAGPKAWGGYQTLAKHKITETPLVNFVKKHCANVLEALKKDSPYIGDQKETITVKVFKHPNGENKVLFSIRDTDFFIAGDKTLDKKDCKIKHIRSSESDLLTYVRSYCTPSATKRILA